MNWATAAGDLAGKLADDRFALIARRRDQQQITHFENATWHQPLP